VFTYTAFGQGYYEVSVDGVVVSRHIAEREALENANYAKLDNPLKTVRVKHDYEVDVALQDAPASADALVGVPVKVTVIANDPAAVTVSGSLIVTPLTDADVVLSVAFEK
jgi:hypothetical protein